MRGTDALTKVSSDLAAKIAAEPDRWWLNLELAKATGYHDRNVRKHMILLTELGVVEAVRVTKPIYYRWSGTTREVGERLAQIREISTSVTRVRS